VLEHRPREMRHPTRLQLAEVAQQRTCRTHRASSIVANPEAGDRHHAKMPCQFVGGERWVELPRVALGHECSVRA